MFCKYCGKQLEDGSRFCTACGQSLVEEAPAAPQYEAPAAPQYEAPQYAAPQYAAPAAAPAAPAAAKKFQLLPFIAAAALGFFAFIDLIVNLATYPHFASIMDSLLCMGAAALFILTLLGVLKKDNLFYAIGMFALAASKLVFIGGLWWFVTVLLVPAFVLAGLYYILKGKLFGNPIKMIMAIAVWAMGFVMFIIYCVNGLNAWVIISSLIMAGAMGLSIFSYTPYKK